MAILSVLTIMSCSSGCFTPAHLSHCCCPYTPAGGVFPECLRLGLGVSHWSLVLRLRLLSSLGLCFWSCLVIACRYAASCLGCSLREALWWSSIVSCCHCCGLSCHGCGLSCHAGACRAILSGGLSSQRGRPVVPFCLVCCVLINLPLPLTATVGGWHANTALCVSVYTTLNALSGAHTTAVLLIAHRCSLVNHLKFCLYLARCKQLLPTRVAIAWGTDGCRHSRCAALHQRSACRCLPLGGGIALCARRPWWAQLKCCQYISSCGVQLLE